ncbi:NAD(P)-dependent oxidoreductase [Patulibacter sp.]|uniref:NAD(P)-dependent oxidoreductase n=1 Tax=Patulibacter sp. TaxID=1912859 RepID=UPI002721DDD2|nr:NAD(P)-dependent oxidoreductase [Patulibacter sp.]MDO9410672.1 NAD(P)-dependent oxidoreductase [Patulibacter sp.]
MPSTPVVAFLGTGTMGAPMVSNLLRAGLTVRVWNRTAEKARPLADEGAELAADPADAVRGADVVVTMLDAADAVRQTIAAAAPGLSTEQVWIQASTVGVAGTQGLIELAGDLGPRFVDAPVLGTLGPAQDGTLVILASGADDAIDVAQPVFDAVGSRTMRVGAAGAGTRLKLVANSWVLAVTAATAEAFALAQGLDLDPRLFVEAVSGGPLDLPYLHVKGQSMLDDAYPTAFSVKNALKDARLVGDAAGEAGVRNGIAAVAAEHLDRAAQAGHGEDDMAALFKGVTHD